MTFAGFKWLQDRFALPNEPLAHVSIIGASPLRIERAEGFVEETYVPQYYPGDRILDHVQFALKYDVLNLGILQAVFQKIDTAEVIEMVESQPTGKYARIIGYLYEGLSGKALPIADREYGNYVQLLDAERYVVAAKPDRNTRWRINDNSLGSLAFCPIVRKTKSIEIGLLSDWQKQIQAVLDGIPQERLTRAISFLYFKETKSSYAIEREPLSGDREHRFVSVLKQAGSQPIHEVLSEAFLTGLQNLIVDSRYARPGFREIQNYIGQSMIDFSEVVHYISPPRDEVRPLMNGLLAAALRQEGVHPIVRAAIISFSFVFIHPFEDGNGRLHRFLLQDCLARDHFTPPGVLLPISASMLADERSYNSALEDFSKKILNLAQYSLDQRGEMTVHNHSELEGYFRFPDLTKQVEYLFSTVERTIQIELPLELTFLKKHDLASNAIRNIVDLPDKRLKLLITYLRQNSGKLSQSKRGQFSEISDTEIQEIESSFAEAFC